jgi:hypothetical protein
MSYRTRRWLWFIVLALIGAFCGYMIAGCSGQLKFGTDQDALDKAAEAAPGAGAAIGGILGGPAGAGIGTVVGGLVGHLLGKRKGVDEGWQQAEDDRLKKKGIEATKPGEA